MQVTYQQIRENEEIRTYIRQADDSLRALGYTEHSFAHATRCAETASRLLLALGYSGREAELAGIAGFMHDIGNVVNRIDHAQSGAMMAFRILGQLGMEPAEIAAVITAIGNHDEGTAYPVNAVAAALIIADKTDVRRSRVRQAENLASDIHDRVNYAVVESAVTLDRAGGTLTLTLTIDPEICPVMDYFEIFLGRMLLCRKASDFFGLRFHLLINGNLLL